MFCIKCGADNSETAVYCRKCGELLEAEDETRVAVRDHGGAVSAGTRNRDGVDSPIEGDEATIFTISPTLLFIKAGYVLAAVGALLLVALLSILAPSISVWIWILFGLLLFVIPAFYHFKQKLISYTLTDSKLEFDAGLLSRTTRNVPIRRIQDVTVSATPLQRLLGFGDLIIDNASEQGGKLVLKNINSPRKYADILLKQMRILEK
jgi:membrane protein YdbS with pleckstrin-like domain